MSESPAVVVFDLDDTLFPEHDYALSGLRYVGRYLEQAHGLSGAAERLVRALESGARGRIFNAVLAEYGLAPARISALIPGLVERYRAHPPDIRLYPEAPAVLAALRGRFPLALITDGPAICQRAKLAALALDLDQVIVTDELGRAFWKPHPLPYQRVEERFGVPGAGCCYIGDNPTKDFVTARARGWRTARVDRGDRLNPSAAPSDDHEARWVVGNLTEALTALGLDCR